MQHYQPTSPGVRHRVKRVGRPRGSPVVPGHLRVTKAKSGGRNNTGRITSAHRGGGRRTPMVRRKVTARPQWHTAEVVAIHKDPHRTAPLARVRPRGSEATKAREYVLAGEGMGPGTKVYVDQPGHPAPFVDHARKRRGDLPLGTSVYGVELHPGRGSQRVKTAGSSAQRVRHRSAEEALAERGIRSRSKGMVVLRLPSKEKRLVSADCMATVGQVAGKEHNLEVRGKAGINRRRGIRPTVRGVAMNPIDHPHGGRTGGGKPEVTPWAQVAKGKPTRRRTSVFRLVP